MYESPIELLITEVTNQIVKEQDKEIYKAVLHYIPNVDKEELIRALQYDRDQYEKGYADGKRDAMESIVRCKDCKHSKWYPDHNVRICNNSDGLLGNVCDGDYCSKGERRTDNA